MPTRLSLLTASCRFVRRRPKQRHYNFVRFPHNGSDACFTAVLPHQVIPNLLPLPSSRCERSRRLEAPPEPALEQLPLQQYKHPYASRCLLWRLCFRTKRFVYLLWVFLPCAAVGFIAVLTGSAKWRERWISVLISSIERSGCSIQKFAQWLSMRPDIAAPDIAEALSKLRTDAPAHELAHTQAVLRESFGVDMNELFEEFETEPISSGTVAQVYRAVLKPEHAFTDNSGKLITEVAVKVRHPAAVAETYCDLSLIFGFISLSKHFHLMVLPLDTSAEEDFSEVLQRQVDLVWEARHLERFAHNFREEIAAGDVAFPAVHHTLVCDEVLVESWCNGRTVDAIFSKVGQFLEAETIEDFDEEAKYLKVRLANILFDVTMKMMIRDNLCHGDLHAGNLLYTSSSEPVTVLDAGLTTSLSEDSWPAFQALLRLMCQGDASRLSNLLQQINLNPDALSTPEKLEAFQEHVAAVVNKWVSPGWITHPSTPSGAPVPLGDLLGNLLFACSAFQLQLPSDVASSITTIAMFEGLICQLNPEFDVVARSLPYFRQYPV